MKGVIDLLSLIGRTILEHPGLIFYAFLIFICIKYRTLSLFLLICILLYAWRKKYGGVL